MAITVRLHRNGGRLRRGEEWRCLGEYGEAGCFLKSNVDPGDGGYIVSTVLPRRSSLTELRKEELCTSSKVTLI